MKGGNRISGTFNKTSTNDAPLISIITVVYNSINFIEATIQSIINQTYTNIEFIIIDGGSKDNTLEIIKQYDTQIAYWLSEPDKGLYDAMNKGIETATGDYLLFINSGDQIYRHDTLEKLFLSSDFQLKNAKFADVYYGETIMIDENSKEIGMRRLSTPQNLSWKSLRNGMCVSHQSIIVKKECAPYYNLNYKYASDFDWVIKSLKKASIITNTSMILSKFLDGGQTKQTIVPGLKERYRIMQENYGMVSTFFRHFVIGFKFLWFVAVNKRF